MNLHINICVSRMNYVWIFIPENGLLVKVNENFDNYMECLDRTKFVALALANTYESLGHQVTVQLMDDNRQSYADSLAGKEPEPIVMER